MKILNYYPVNLRDLFRIGNIDEIDPEIYMMGG